PIVAQKHTAAVSVRILIKGFLSKICVGARERIVAAAGNKVSTHNFTLRQARFQHVLDVTKRLEERGGHQQRLVTLDPHRRRWGFACRRAGIDVRRDWSSCTASFARMVDVDTVSESD